MKNIKNIAFLFVFFLSISLMGQNRMKRMDQEKIKAYKIAYITDQLNLTSKEAQKFWPIYNEISEEIENLKREMRREIVKEIKEKGGLENISENTASGILKKDIAMKEAVLRFEKKMNTKLQEFLPYKKILKLHIAEKDFKKELFRKLKERRKKFKKE